MNPIRLRPDENSDDDEATISKLEDTNDKEEGDRLQKESEMSIEELMKKFYSETPGDGDEGEDVEKGNEEGEGETGSEEKETPDDSAAQSSVDVSDADDEGDDGSGKDDDDDDVEGEEDKRSNLKSLVSGEDDKFYDAIEMAETFQVKRQNYVSSGISK